MPANYSLNFDFGTCSVSPLGRGKKPSRLQQMLGDDPFENSLVEQMSLINKAIFQAPAPSYSKRCVTIRFFFVSRSRDVRFFASVSQTRRRAPSPPCAHTDFSALFLSLSC